MTAQTERYTAYLIIGAPGSGKGTQGRTLGTIPRFYHCACGDVFRSLELRTSLGQKFLEYSSRGELVPDDLTVQLWKLRIEANVDAGLFKPDIDHLVLDGIPRNLEQARLMEEMVDVRLVFHLFCADQEELVSRIRKRALKENRYDDASDEVIRRRLLTYEEETRPVLDFYGLDRMVTLDALKPPVAVLGRVIEHILARSP